jgi:hypothetical protein
MEMRAGCGSDRNGKLFMKGFIAIFLCASKLDFLPFTSLVLQIQYARSNKKDRAYALHHLFFIGKQTISSSFCADETEIFYTTIPHLF